MISLVGALALNSVCQGSGRTCSWCNAVVFFGGGRLIFLTFGDSSMSAYIQVDGWLSALLVFYFSTVASLGWSTHFGKVIFFSVCLTDLSFCEHGTPVLNCMPCLSNNMSAVEGAV